MLIDEKPVNTGLSIIWRVLCGIWWLFCACIRAFLWGFAFFEIMFTHKKHYSLITKLMIYFEGKKAFKAMTQGRH